MTLPVGFSPLPFSVARGIPQTVPFTVGSHNLRITLAASATDLRALLQVGATTQVVDVNDNGHSRATSVPEDVAERFRSPAPMTLSGQVVRPMIMVRDEERLVGARPVSTQRYLSFGRNERNGLVVELFIDAFVLTAGTFTRPGDVGGRIIIGARPAVNGITQSTVAPIAPDSIFRDAGGELSWALL